MKSSHAALAAAVTALALAVLWPRGEERAPPGDRTRDQAAEAPAEQDSRAPSAIESVAGAAAPSALASSASEGIDGAASATGHEIALLATPDDEAPAPAAERVRVFGRVTDEHGRPVGGATVRVHNRAQGLDSVIAATTTDAEGGYEVANLAWPWGAAGAEAVSIVAEAPGLAPGARRGEVEPNAAEVELDVELFRGQPLAGRVVWSTGESVPNARFMIYGPTFARGRTDGSGRFRVEHLPPGNVTIAVAPEEGQPYQHGGRHAAGRDDVTVTLLPRIGVITGYVLAGLTGDLVPGELVAVGDDVSGMLSWTATTDADGAFRFEEIPLESWRVHCPGRPGVEESVRLDEARPEVEVILGTPVEIEVGGMAADVETGEGIPGLPLRISGANHFGDTIGDERAVITDEEGRFSASGVSVRAAGDGTVLIQFRADTPEWVFGGGRRERRTPVASLEEAADLRLPMIRGNVLTITAADPEGNPLPGAQMAILGPANIEMELGESDSRGEVRAIVPSTWPQVQAAGWHPDWPVLLSPVLSGTDVAETTAVALPVRALEVRVLRTDDTPVSGATVIQQSRPPLLRGYPPMIFYARAPHPQTDADGRATLLRAPETTLALTARESGNGDLNGEAIVDLSAGQDPGEVVIRLQPMDEVTVAGRVQNPEGRPIAGAEVWLGYESARGRSGISPPAISGPDGRFTVTGPRGRVWEGLTAHAEGYSSGGSGRLPERPGEVTITLHPETVLTGRVVLPGGQPARPGPILSLFFPTHDATGWELGMTATETADRPGVDGRFRWRLEAFSPSEAPRPAFLLASTRHGLVATADFALDLREGGEIDLGTLTLGEGFTISGTVRGTDGQPLRGATVRWETTHGTDARPTWLASADSEGRYRLTPIPPGHWRIHGRDPDHTGQTVEIDVAGDVVRDFVLEPIHTVTVTVRVIGYDGRPAAGCWTEISRDGVPVRLTTSDAGLAVFERVPTGSGVIVVMPGLSQSNQVQQLVQIPTHDHTVTVDLSSWRSVRGRITQGGEAVTRAELLLQASHQEQYALDQPVTDGEGRYQAMLPPGAVTLRYAGVSASTEALGPVTLDLEIPAR